MLALVSSDGDVLATVEEAVRGVVPAKRSSGHVEGFPYRSILFLLEINKYYDQNIMTAEETEKYNHRKRAVEKLVPVLQQIAS